MSEDAVRYGNGPDSAPRPGERFADYSRRVLDHLVQASATPRVLDVRPFAGLEIQLAPGERIVAYEDSDGRVRTIALDRRCGEENVTCRSK